VILLTGWGERQSDDKPGRDIVDRVLNKPVRLQELLQIIAELTPDPETRKRFRVRPRPYPKWIS
jgi:hypothetical protein